MAESEMVSAVADAIGWKLAERGVIINYTHEIARAAIEAMREPTEEMMWRGQQTWREDGFARLAYQAMIDAALK